MRGPGLLPVISVARRSMRGRRGDFAATFLTIAASTVVVGSFAVLLESAFGDVSATDQETLATMGAVIGGWGGLIALFALVSTLGVAVRRRTREIGRLRLIGATPRQARRLIRLETLGVAVPAAAVGAALAWPGGRLLFERLRDAGMLSPDADPAPGGLALSVTAVAVVAICLIAAGVTGVRATRSRAGGALAAVRDSGLDGGPGGTDGVGARRLPRWRWVVGVVLLGYATALGFVTVLVMADSDDPYAPMQTSGSACVLAGIGVAVLAPALLAPVARLLRPLLERVDVSAALAADNAVARARLLGGVVGPIAVFVATATGVLMLAGIDARTLVLAPGTTQQDADTVNLLNLVVTGMIAVFAGILVVNSLLALVDERHAEIARLRLVGATPDQVRRSLRAEGLLVGTVGCVLGLVGSLATVVPFSMARHEGVVPDAQLWLPVVVAAVAMGLVLATTRAAAGRAVRRGNPVAVVAAA